MDKAVLEGVLAVELGGREAVATCGSLLAQLGATVLVVEPVEAGRMRDRCRPQFLAGKLSLGFDEASPQDVDLLQQLVAKSDILITSSDVDADSILSAVRTAKGIVCDVTAFGASRRHVPPLSEMQVQAVSGLMDTTGEADGPPVAIGVPVVNYLSGTYAAAAVLAALRVWRLQRTSQHVDISMFECAFLTLNAFLSGVLTGQAGNRTRMGNRHPTVAPWNVYETQDGWVLICVGNDKQWMRLYDLIGRPGEPSDFETQAARIANVDALDRAITGWTRRRPTADCVEALLAIDVPTGPIAPIDKYPREKNIDYRGMIRSVFDPGSGSDIFVAGSPLKLSAARVAQPARIPAHDGDRAAVQDILAARDVVDVAPPDGSFAPPLAGLRVVELGQYTSAPLCSRHLAHLGAEVIKIEQPGGDAQRTWVPQLGGQSATFRLNNTDKRSMVLDLRTAEGRETLRALLETSDVVIENMRPGALAKYGFSYAEMAEINPRLVYGDISGFGADSIYEGRPAFDMVVQAMSGFMSAVRPGGTPLKSGISTADMMVAELGIVGILAALEQREATGRGQHVDLAMQDVTCWVTAPSWNVDPSDIPTPSVLRCSDGFVMSDASESDLLAAFADDHRSIDDLARMERAEAVSVLTGLGLSAAPVLSIREASELPQIGERRTWFTITENGIAWPVLACPLRLALTPPTVSRLIAEADGDGDAIRAALARPPSSTTPA